MAYESLGQSFLPRIDGTDGGAGSGGARLEDVLRVLSFRLPRILGGRPIAPAQLLNSQGGAGDPLGSAVAQGVLQSLMQGAPGGGAPGPFGGAPTAMPGGSDAGAPSPLSQLFAPFFGAGQVEGLADLPSPSKSPRIIPIEDPTLPGGTAGPDPFFGGGSSSSLRDRTGGSSSRLR